MSLRIRLLLGLVPMFILGLVAAEVGTYAALQDFLLKRVDLQLLSAHPLIESLLVSGTGNSGASGGGEGLRISLPPGTYGELRSSSGITIAQRAFEFASNASAQPVLPAHLVPGSAGAPNLLTVPGRGNVRRYRVYVDTDNQGDGGVFIAAIPLDDVDSTLAQLVLLELGISGVVTLVLAATTWAIVRHGLGPLERMGRTARSIVASDLGQRIAPATARTEVGRLGLALNAMLAQLESAFAARAAGEARLRRFVSDASHELRTPLTSIRGYAELFRRNRGMDREEIALAMQRIEDEARRMGVLVDDLLLLARLDQGRPLERRPVDLEALVTDACANARVSDPGRAVTLRVEAPLVVTGDELRLRQVLGNLISNAIVHTPARTPIEVGLRPIGSAAVVEVADHGPGIAAADVEQIFERFHRADPERSRDQGGSGLGLSIVAAVVAAHHGRVHVGPTPGGGATFRVELPLSGEGESGASPRGAASK